MFDSDLGAERSSGKIRRRAFLLTLAAGVAAELWHSFRPSLVGASPSEPPRQVTIVLFSDKGERLKTVRVTKVVKSESEWKRQLSPAAFDITRRADTEIPESGRYWNTDDKGLYRCVCCGNALFSSAAKFHSGTGWPSFWDVIAPENIQTATDTSFFMLRTAVSCTQCDAHLGHLFNDGPPPTNLRYCMNSAALRFVAA